MQVHTAWPILASACPATFDYIGAFPSHCVDDTSSSLPWPAFLRTRAHGCGQQQCRGELDAHHVGNRRG